MSRQDISILETIHGSYYKLSAAERKVADFVLANSSSVQFMSITQLASESGTADATVSRFCKQLKLKGFNAFKMELAKCSVNAAADASAHSHDHDGRRSSIKQLAIEAVNQTLELLDEESVLKTVELFEKAKRIECMGSGGSMITALECAHLFSTVTGKFYAVSDSHMQMSAAATMSTNDAIMLFSYSGATTNGLEVLELAKSRGIPTVLVTRFHKSPAAKLADVVLRCGSNEGPFQFGSVPAKVAQLMVVDVLFQEYCYRNQASCEENIRRIASALAGKHV